MAWTEADLTTIRAHIASGVKSVTYADGRKAEYHDIAGMLAAEKVIKAAVDMQAQAVTGYVRRRFGAFRRGL